jgi:exodeoxyribonuclease VII small subunit
LSPKKSAQKSPTAPEIRYSDAMEELERILEALEDDAVDVDQLAQQVRRASELLKLCRERLTETQVEIEKVVAEFDAAGADNADAGA